MTTSTSLSSEPQNNDEVFSLGLPWIFQITHATGSEKHSSLFTFRPTIVHRCGTSGSMRACHTAGPGSNPGWDKFSGWRFFEVFPHLYDKCREALGPQGPRISFGHHYHPYSFITGANDLRCWRALKPQTYIHTDRMTIIISDRWDLQLNVGSILLLSSVFCPRAGPPLQTQAPRLKFCPKADLTLQTQEPRLQIY